MKNITNIVLIVIAAATGSFSISSCGLVTSNGAAQSDVDATAPFTPPTVTGALRSPDLREASGIAASLCQPGVYWTHNDSGDGAFLYALNEKGEHLGTWAIAGASNRDWEDISTFRSGNSCGIYIGDIGDNDLKRDDLTIYRVAEPTVSSETSRSHKGAPLDAHPSTVLLFRYPDGRSDAETLLSSPDGNEIYVLTKSKKLPVSVYKLIAGASDPQVAQKVAQFTVPAVPNGFLTGGAISPDGRRVVLCDYFAGYELLLPAGELKFDEIWDEKPRRFDLGKREVGEAVTYTADGKAVIALSEKRHTPVIKAERIEK